MDTISRDVIIGMTSISLNKCTTKGVFIVGTLWGIQSMINVGYTDINHIQWNLIILVTMGPEYAGCYSMEAKKCNLPHNAISACGGPELCTQANVLRMRRCLFGVQRLCSACGGSILTCGDLFFKPSQPSHFITPPVLIASILACLTSWKASSAGTVTSTRLWLRKGPAWRVWVVRLCLATVKTESQSAPHHN